ncbi:hypothetical protein EON64_21045, partial [archaeon]
MTHSTQTFCPLCSRPTDLPPVSCVDYTARRGYLEDPHPSISTYRRLVIALDTALVRSELDLPQSTSLWSLVRAMLSAVHASVQVSLVLY